MVFNNPDRIKALTPLNPFDRLGDGRPKVPDDLLERLKLVTVDEAWNLLEPKENYCFQFEGDWTVHLHPSVPLVGRVVTASYVPKRPDFHDVVQADGVAEGRSGGQNTWVIDQLQPGDVLVVDLFGKVKDGTFIGDNLATAARARTGTGMIIDGGIRDSVRIDELEDFPVYARGIHPTGIAQVTLREVNGPIRIGDTTVMPGDAVLGTPAGVIFIPPHLLERIVEESEDTRQRDVFGKMRLAEGTYTSGEIDVNVWQEDIERDYQGWLAAQS